MSRNAILDQDIVPLSYSILSYWAYKYKFSILFLFYLFSRVCPTCDLHVVNIFAKRIALSLHHAVWSMGCMQYRLHSHHAAVHPYVPGRLFPAARYGERHGMETWGAGQACMSGPNLSAILHSTLHYTAHWVMEAEWVNILVSSRYRKQPSGRAWRRQQDEIDSRNYNANPWVPRVAISRKWLQGGGMQFY
jgi:hypothetical protein